MFITNYKVLFKCFCLFTKELNRKEKKTQVVKEKTELQGVNVTS